MGDWLESRKLAGKHYDNHQDTALLLGPPGELLGRCEGCSAAWLSVECLAAGTGLRKLLSFCLNSAYLLQGTALAG